MISLDSLSLCLNQGYATEWEDSSPGAGNRKRVLLRLGSLNYRKHIN